MTLSLAEEHTANHAKPTTEFLEFLGEWETEEGDWIDPIALESEEVAKLIDTMNENDN